MKRKVLRMLNLVSVITESVKSRRKKFEDVQNQRRELSDLLFQKEQLLGEKEKEYNQHFDDNLLDEIKNLKKDTHDLKSELASLPELVKGDVRFFHDSKEAILELDQKVADLNFNNLKANIADARNNYIKALEAYEAAVISLVDERRDIRCIENHVDIETLRTIDNWFNRTYNRLYLDHEERLGNTRTNVEKNLFDSISNNVNLMSSGDAYRFGSL